MAHPAGILADKLERPARREKLVARPRLLTRLTAAVQARLTLVAAPPGFGKTTLLAQWFDTAGAGAIHRAWVSLDAADADPTRFWTHVVTALDRIHPGVGGPALAVLAAPRPPSIEDILALLVNGFSELNARDGETVLVLDDYHLVDPGGAAAGSAWPPAGEHAALGGVHRGVDFLLQHLPRRLHLVIATRIDPPLALARLRARGELVEVRAVDLRFTPAEASAFLNVTMSLDLTDAQADALDARTQGWVAGLQLAGLALQHQEDFDGGVTGFIAEFAGSDRFIVDYLGQEVLSRQPPHVLAFLARTCILDRLCGDLCDALVDPAERDDVGAARPVSGQSMLEALESGHLFLTRLDRERRWFRYHPLFADVLRARLHTEDERGIRVDLPRLHRRASSWFERAGLLPEAIRHALACGDLERVADLVETVPRVQFITPVQSALRGWLASLPAELVRRRPQLCLLEAWRLLQAGDLDGADRHVHLAESLLAESGRSCNGKTKDQNVHGEIAVIRGFLMLGRESPEAQAVIDGVDAAGTLLDRDNATFRGMAQMCLGHAALLLGQGARGERAFAAALRLGRDAEAPHVAVMAAAYLAAAQRLRGRHRLATATVRDALRHADRSRAAVAGRVGLLRVLLADALLESGDPARAAEQADQAVAGARISGLPPMLGYSLLAQARSRHASGDLDGALAVLDDARTALAIDHEPGGRAGGPAGASAWIALDACRAQIWLSRGDLAAAMEWADRHELEASTGSLLGGARPGSVAFAAAYECELVRIAPVQVRLAQARAADDLNAARRARDLLAVLDRIAAGHGAGWLRVKVLVLRALADAVLDQEARALNHLAEAVVLAEPEGYVDLFAQERAPLAALLTKLRLSRARRARALSITYLDRLLGACARPAPGRPDGAPLVEPPTSRELEVLQMMAAGLGNAEIARALFVAPSTVKTHVNHLFAKLGVASRTQAVARARELRLL